MSILTTRRATTGDDDLTRFQPLVREIREFLERIRNSLDEEIKHYPTPIPRCDAQFNFLHEQRARLSQQLARLGASAESGLSPDGYREFLSDFIGSPPFADGADEQSLRSRVAAVLSQPKLS